MKPNMWNVKDILNIPVNSVGAKTGKGGAASDYWNPSDSQFLFGSQTWTDNSQSFSQEISGQSRGSQQASQEINETKVSTSYHSKPMLFGDSKVTNISGGRNMGILDRFEDEKRKAKEIEILIGVRQLHESVDNLKKTFLNCIDGTCDIMRAAVAEGIDTFKKTFLDNVSIIKENIASQYELLMGQICKDMKDYEAKTSLALTDLSSLVLSLQEDLKSLKLEQSNEQILSLLGTLINAYSTGAHRGPVRMLDHTVQTSPGLVSQFCVVSEEKHHYDGMKLCSEAFNYIEKKVDQNICPSKKGPPVKLGKKSSFHIIGTQPLENRLHIGHQRSHAHDCPKSYNFCSVTSTSLSPEPLSTVAALVHVPKNNYMARVPVHKETVNYLNDMNNNRSPIWIEVPREKKAPKRAQRCQTFRNKKRALIPPQRQFNQANMNNEFEYSQHNDQENRVPKPAIRACKKTSKAVSGNCLPLQQQSTSPLMNTSECCQHLEPWSLSQSSNSSQVVVEYQQAEWKSVKPEQQATAIQRQRVTWQLFDFISDSD